MDGFFFGILTSFGVLLVALNWKSSKTYNKSAFMRVVEDKCHNVLTFVINGDISLAQLIHDLSNHRLVIPGVSTDPAHGSV